MPTPSFWQDKRVFLTGHTGFKGSWLAIWLSRLGAHVTGVSLDPATTPNLFDLTGVDTFCDSHICDIRDESKLASIIQQAQPEIVLHLAAQPLVRASYRQPVDTFATNVMGTAHLLNSLRGEASARVVVMVTTDKVYQNNEWYWPYRESDALGGYDPYSASKAASEVVISSFRSSFLAEQGLAIASARAGNVIGGGDWSEDRLIPDAVRAWQSGQALEIRRPESIRPWQHVLEPLAGYLTLAEKLWEKPGLADAYNFGPHTHEAATVKDVVELARAVYGTGKVNYGDGTNGPHEAGWLALEVSKARSLLGISPQWGLQETVTRTINWYRSQQAGGDALALCQNEIAAYEACCEPV